MGLRNLALGPFVVLAALILVTLLYGFSEMFAFDPPYLLLGLNIIFWTGATAAIAIVSAKSFSRDGSLTVLLLSSSIITLGISVIVAGWAGTFSGNYSVAIGNICPLAASILQVLGSFVSLEEEREITSGRKVLLAAVYLASIVFVGVISIVVLQGYTPPFFTESGPTLLRQTVLGLTVFFFAVASLIFLVQYSRSRSPALFWYTLAIGLFSLGFLIVFEANVIGDVPTWLGRTALYVGSSYLVVALYKSRLGTDMASSWAESFRSDRQQLATLSSKMLDGFGYHRIIVDNHGKPIDYVFLAVNDAFERMTGLNRSRIIGRKATEVIPGIEEDPGNWINTYGRVALAGESVQFENYSALLMKWFSVSAYSPRKGYFVSLFEDITQLKKTQEKLEESAAKLEEYAKNLETLVEERTKKLELSSLYARNLIEASLDPLVTISVEGKITDVNRATELATGCSRKQLIGSDFSDYFTEPEKAKIGYKRVFTEGFVRDYPLAIRHISGKITDVLYNATVYTDEAGEVQGVFAAARDITELKKAEEQAQESAEKLKDAERLAAIGATAGMVGHDIRNPLQAIIGDLYLAKTDLSSSPESEEKGSIQESLESIEKSVDYVNKIVADLQDYARPLRPVTQEIDIEPVVNDLLTRNAVPENIRVSSRVEKDAQKVVVDPSLLKRILGNLFTNAVQAMPEGGKLSLHFFREATDYVMRVKDTGIGIPEEVRDKLFTPLFTTKSKGQGFGLAVVKRLTEALNGTVAFESVQGTGTTFVVRLPQER